MGLMLLAATVLSGCLSSYHSALNEWSLADRRLLSVRLEEAGAALEDACDAVADAISVARRSPRGDDAERGLRQRIEAADLKVYQVGKKVAAARDVLLQRFSSDGGEAQIVADAQDMLEQLGQAAQDLALVNAMLSTSSPVDVIRRQFDQVKERAQLQRKNHRRLIDALRRDD